MHVHSAGKIGIERLPHRNNSASDRAMDQFLELQYFTEELTSVSKWFAVPNYRRLIMFGERSQMSFLTAALTVDIESNVLPI